MKFKWRMKNLQGEFHIEFHSSFWRYNTISIFCLIKNLNYEIRNT